MTVQKTVRNPLQKKGLYSGSSASRTVGGPDGLLANMKPFKGTTMSADCFNPETFESPGGLGGGLGRLPGHFCTQILAASPIYVVYSWATPIAWVDNEGDVWIPGVTYSVTTTQQQNMCRVWLTGHSSTMIKVWKMMEEGTWA